MSTEITLDGWHDVWDFLGSNFVKTFPECLLTACLSLVGVRIACSARFHSAVSCFFYDFLVACVF